MKRSRKLGWSELRVGMLVLVGLIVLMVVILQLGRTTGFFRKTVTYRVLLESAEGLKQGDVVRVAGVDKGNVRRVRFVPPPSPGERGKIEVILEVDAAVAEWVRRDSVVTIGTMGLLGDKFAEVSLGDPIKPAVEPGGTIEGRSEIEFRRLLSGGATTLVTLEETLQGVRRVVASIERGEGTFGRLVRDPALYRSLREAASHIEGVSDRIRRGEGTLGKLAQDPALYDDLRAAAAQIRRFLGRLEQGALGKLAEDPALYQDLRNAAARLDRILGRLEKGEGTVGKLLQDDQLHRQLSELARNLDLLVKDIRENPQRYFKFSLF
ncbi:MAG: MCE family protein [Nitrospirae bacterium]|nr:MCE family protein [Nitrospirota bacterium]